MNSKDLSYYRLSLMDFLSESHPELMTDKHFITARSEAAAEACEQAARNGSHPIEAGEAANEVLFKGLHFSKHDTLKNILWNEFFNEIPEDEAKTFAIQLMPECEPVFAKYPLTADFAYSPEYNLLYTELVGAISCVIPYGHEKIRNS